MFLILTGNSISLKSSQALLILAEWRSNNKYLNKHETIKVMII